MKIENLSIAWVAANSYKKRPKSQADKERQKKAAKLRQQKLLEENLRQRELVKQRRKEEDIRKYRKLYEIIKKPDFKGWYFRATGEYWKDKYEEDIYLLLNHIKSAAMWEEIKQHSKHYAQNSRPYWITQLLGGELKANKRRYIIQILATPKWANNEEITKIYAERDRMTCETGIQHHVDHIIPLQNSIVCGLHVPANLRVIEGIENIRKNNKFTP